MEREAEKYRAPDFEAHEADEMTAAELADMQLGSDFFSADDLAALMPDTSKMAKKSRSPRSIFTIRWASISKNNFGKKINKRRNYTNRNRVA